jgi:hypothetical protein
MLESSDKNVEEGVRRAGNHGALNANRKLLGGGGRKHWGGFMNKLRTWLACPAPPPTPTTRPLYTVTAAFNTLCVHQNKACCKIVASTGLSYIVRKYLLKIRLTQYVLISISYGRCKINFVNTVMLFINKIIKNCSYFGCVKIWILLTKVKLKFRFCLYTTSGSV